MIRLRVLYVESICTLTACFLSDIIAAWNGGLATGTEVGGALVPR
jgi:hypothetical protein